MTRIAHIALPFLALSSLVACATEAQDDEEDAIADAAPSGKSDASGFPTGPYVARESEFLPGAAISAYFHETGQVDLTRVLSEDFDNEYVTGTFKIYKYAGKDRVRITSDDGTVVLRSDWAVGDDGDMEFADKAWYQPRRLPEEIIDCLTMNVVDNGVFEESLSTWEYPNVSLQKEGTEYSLHIGGSSFDATEAKITLTDKPTEQVATAILEDDYGYGIRVPKASPRRGEVFFLETAAGTPQMVANIVCR